MLLIDWEATWLYITQDWPIIVIAIIAGMLGHWLLYHFIQAITPNHTSEDINFVVRKIRNPTVIVFVLAAVNIAVRTLHLEPGIAVVLNRLSSIFLIIATTWSLAAAVRIFRLFALRKYDVSEADNLLARKRLTQFKVLERIVIAVIVVVGTGAILMTFEGVRAFGTSILASAGIAGIIIGFAAQRSIATFFAGVQIAITQPIRLDDAVVVEGEWGWIEEITFTYVVIRIWDQRRLVVPINYFIEKPFQNWTRTSADILGTVFMYTDYTVSVDAIRKELDRILENEGSGLWDKRVKVVQVTDATEKTMELRILVSAGNSPTAWDLRVLVREKMIDFLQKNYPQSLPRTRIKIDDQKEFKELENTPRTGPGKTTP